jgi:hypothetical protein
MQFHRRDVVNALWALGLPFLIAAVCTIFGMAVINHTSLMDITSLMDLPQVPEGTTLPGMTMVTLAYWGALGLSSAAGYVFARRLFARHAIAVAVIYLPLMFYALVWFSFGVQLAVTGGP